jgi:HTH-type transcriptional regulator, competence development regulator
MTLAEFIADARSRRGWTLREFEEKAADLNHTYIWRLEKGDRGKKPSRETIEKLSSALNLNDRDQQILLLLAKQDIDDALFKLMKDEKQIPWSAFEIAATATSFRGTPKSEDEWRRTIEIINDAF